MASKNSGRIAFADAIIQILWIKGLITKIEYSEMKKQSAEAIKELR